MATRSIANSNNFIRWDKVTGVLTEDDLRASRLLPPYTETTVVNDFINSTNNQYSFTDIANDGDNTFIAISSGGELIRSTDYGESWEDLTAPASNQWAAIAYGDGVWSIIANSGSFRSYISNDNGDTWSLGQGTPFDLTKLALINTFDVSTQETSPSNVKFNNNGTKFYIIGSADVIYEYVISTPYDLSTASINASFSVSSQTTTAQHLFIRTDGTQIFVGDNSGNIYTYNLGTAFDITTASFLGTTSLSGVFLLSGITFSNDGLLLIVGDILLGTIRKYILSTAWDVSSSTFNQSFALNITDLFFKSDGLTAYFQTGLSVEEYSLSSSFDITTLSATGNAFNLSTISASPQGFTFSPNGLKLYYVDSSTANAYQLDVIKSQIDSNTWESLQYGNGRFLAVASVGTNRIAYSTNGLEFTSSTSPSNVYSDIVYGLNNDWVAVASSGTNRIVKSTDNGVTFNAVTAPSRIYTGITFGNGVYIACNDGTNEIQLSYDGTTWETRANLPAITTNWQGAGFGSDVFMLCSNLGGNRVVYSLDAGRSWVELSPAANSWVGVSLNNANRVVLFSTTGTNRIAFSEITKNAKYGSEIQFNDIERTVVTLKPNETLSFYANIDTLEDNANFSNWNLNLIDYKSLITQYRNIATLTKDIIIGSDYRFYLDGFTIPFNIEENCYRFTIVDTTDDSIIYISNPVRFSKNISPYSKRIQYRNDKNILNFNYEGLPSFKNEFRIDLVVRNPVYNTNRIGYDLVNGSFNPVRTVKGQSKECVTPAYDEYDHEAFNAATIHELEIFENGQYEQYDRSEGAEYAVDWLENYPLADGTIFLERRNSYSSNKNV